MKGDEMNRFFISNEPKYRLFRTIVQGIIGVLIANVDILVNGLAFSPEVKGLIVALVMAILSPIMASMGTTSMPEKGELPYNYFEEEYIGVEGEDEEGEEDYGNIE